MQLNLDTRMMRTYIGVNAPDAIASLTEVFKRIDLSGR